MRCGSLPPWWSRPHLLLLNGFPMLTILSFLFKTLSLDF